MIPFKFSNTSKEFPESLYHTIGASLERLGIIKDNTIIQSGPKRDIKVKNWLDYYESGAGWFPLDLF